MLKTAESTFVLMGNFMKMILVLVSNYFTQKDKRLFFWPSNLESHVKLLLCRFTAADVIVGYSVFWLSLINEGVLIKHAPSVQQYLNRIKMRPLWKKCMDGPNGTDPDWVAITRRTTRR